MKDQDSVPEANIPPEIVEKRAALIAREAGRRTFEVQAADREQALQEVTREIRENGRVDPDH